MAEIGETLRETRMRRRIDMTEVEAATKIRAKYLRALENEEWDLLPGPTFVKTFLRTYAEYLELDPQILVEEYRQRFERPSTQDLTPFGPGMGGARAAGSARGDRSARSSCSSSGSSRCWAPSTCSASSGVTRTRTRSRTPWPPSRRRPRPPRPRARARRAQEEEVAAAAGLAAADRQRPRLRLPGRRHGAQGARRLQLEAGPAHEAYRSQRFRANFGNGSVRMTVNGKSYRGAGHRAADRVRVPARQEASPALGVGARGALRDVSVRAGIVVTGTEVLSGLIRDANGPWLSEALRARGVVVSHIVVVGDRPDDLRSALDFLAGSAST